jgi:hypothetical protein
MMAFSGFRAGEALYVAPLCPAGHLPHMEGDQPAALASPIASAAEIPVSPKLPISPLVGEMSGKTEGGVVERPTACEAHL